MWEALEPLVTHAILTILAAAVPLSVAWMRARTQRYVVEQATIEAEYLGRDAPISGPEKKHYAMTLSSTRMGLLTRPTSEKLDAMVEAAVPVAQSTVPPPKP